MSSLPPHLTPGELAGNVGGPNRLRTCAQILFGQAGILQSDPVRIEGGAIRPEHNDDLANGIDDRAEVLFLLPELLLGALAIVNVDMDSIPADDAAVFIVDWLHRDMEPA